MQAEDIDIQLWAYIDGTNTAKEQQRVAALIVQDGVWKEKYEELLAFHQMVQADIQAEPLSSSFADKVMAKIETPVAQKTTASVALTWGIRAVAAFFIISISTMLAYYIVTADFSIAETTAVTRPNITIPTSVKSTASLLASFATLFFLLIAADNLFRRRMA